ncbi:golgin subfamily A member 6-like protein 25 [Bactrocera oleae]|uniref:golgin subfamily A member 6-like protein 25 n=1 Tax=Bactrocera oleae TaxID=104688 RepID=UPI00387E8D10
MCTCNNAFTDCEYHLDPLTAEEQLDEVERMFREKNQVRTAGRKKQCANNTPPTICCNCACTCGGGGGTSPAPNQIERRNGLQNIDRCNGGGQCVMCCENMGDTRMGELSEAEAIANAIREYCCKERERASGGGKSACKCCACEQPLAAEEEKAQGEAIEEHESYEDAEDIDADVEEEEVEIVKHKRVVKEEIVIEEKIQSKMREDELTEDEEIEYIEAASKERRKSQDNAAVNPNRNHAKSCKCCACKKEVTQDIDLDSDSGDDIISLGDIELEVQTDMIRTQQDQYDKPSGPTNGRHSQDSTTKSNRCCTCEKGTTTDFLQEAEMIMKNTNLMAESSEEIKPTKAQLTQQIDEEARAKPQRRRSDEPRSEKIRRDQTDAIGCRCCECKEKMKESDKLTRDTEQHRKSRNEEDNNRRRSSVEGEQELRLKETHKKLRHEKDNRRRRSSVEDEQAQRLKETHREPRNDEGNWRRRSSIEGEQEPRLGDMRRKSGNEENNRRRRSSIEGEQAQRLKETHRNPGNEEDNRRRRSSIESEQEPRLGEAQPRWHVRGEKWQQQDEMVMGAARQPRRQPRKSDDATNETPSGDNRCCECKPRDRRVVASKPEGMDKQPNKSSDSEADSSEQQLCCCFQRKKPQTKRANVSGNDGSKSCRCKEEQTAAAKSHKRVKRTNSELYDSEPKEPQRKRRNSERIISSNKETGCQTKCNCRKAKGVPLTKCCKCTEEMVQSMVREHDEDMQRRKIAEELAERLQKRAELQIALQKRLQQQMNGQQNQQGCCCCEPPPFCMPTYPCCGSMKQPEPIPLSCYETPPCCCPPTPCCFETPACCYEPPPCYGQECSCCCQPMQYCCSASCSHPKPGSC